MKDKILQGLKFVVFLGLGVFLAWWVIHGLTEEQRHQVLDAMRNADYFWLALSIGIGSIAQISRAIRWQILIKPLGYRPGFWNTLFAVMISYGANMLFPRLGEVTRCAIINKYEKVPVQHLLGTVITERILDVLALGVVLLIGFVMEFDKILEYFSRDLPTAGVPEPEPGFLPKHFFLYMAGIGLLTASVAFLLFRKKILELRFYHKIRNAAMGLLDGVKSIRRVDKPFTLVFHSIFIWLCYYGMLHVSIFCIPETSNLPVGAVITTFVAGAIAMIVSPGGIGAYPAFVMAALMLYGIDEAYGTAFGWLAWGSQQVSLVISTIISLILLPIINRGTPKANVQPTAHTS